MQTYLFLINKTYQRSSCPRHSPRASNAKWVAVTSRSFFITSSIHVFRAATGRACVIVPNRTTLLLSSPIQITKSITFIGRSSVFIEHGSDINYGFQSTAYHPIPPFGTEDAYRSFHMTSMPPEQAGTLCRVSKAKRRLYQMALSNLEVYRVSD